MTTFIPSLTLPHHIFASPAASILLPIAAGTFVGFAVSSEKTRTTYKELRQPPLAPPPWVFGPAWTCLYASMGYAAYRAWTVGVNNFDVEKVAMARHGATLYTIQMGLNLIWTPLFFGLKRPIEATVDIVALTGTVGYLIYVWGQVDEMAGWLLAPYAAWLGFATYLCAATGYLNNWDFKQTPPSKSK